MKPLLAVALLFALTSTAAAAPPTEAELVTCIGTAKSWNPTVFAKLVAKMTPAEVAKAFPGADKVSKYGFVTVKAEGCPGITEYEFYFAKEKGSEEPTALGSLRINFDPALTGDPEFYPMLVKVLQAKYGKVKKQDEIDKKLITWVNRKFKTAQLSLKPGRSSQFQLNVRP